MSRVSAQLRRLVIARASERCEYCGLAQAGQEATFHIDHITPVAAGGETGADNLALACVSCSLRKSAKQTALDPETNGEVPLFNPRRHRWDVHFRWNGAQLIGRTAVGRVTIVVLEINTADRVLLRQALIDEGVFPPVA